MGKIQFEARIIGRKRATYHALMDEMVPVLRKARVSAA
jgi:hypothetical protein